MKKKGWVIGTFLLSLVMLIISVNPMKTLAAAIDNVVLTQKAENGVIVQDVTITGKLPETGIQSVGIEVLKPGKSVNDIDPQVSETYLLALDMVKQIKTDSTGQYTFTYRIKGSTAKYHVRVGYEGQAQTAIYDFDCYTPEAYVLKAIQQTKTYGEVMPIIVGNNIIIGLDFNNYNTLKDKAAVDKALKGRLFNSIQELKNAFNTAVEEQTKIEASLKNKGGTGDGKKGANISMNGQTQSPAVVPLPFQESEKMNAVEFADVESVPWAQESIVQLFKMGVIDGVGDNKFNPEDQVTREQFVKLLVKAFKLVDSEAKSTFADVDPNDWCYPYVASAKRHGIVNGSSDANFGIGQCITRQEMAALVFRTIKLANIVIPENNEESIFSDKDEISDYASEAVGKLNKAGIINGYTDGKFKPDSFCSRAEAVKIIYGAYKYTKNIK